MEMKKINEEDTQKIYEEDELFYINMITTSTTQNTMIISATALNLLI